MQSIILFLLGILVGVLAVAILLRVRSVGSLRVDTSDPDGPYLFLELHQGVEAIYKRHYVVLKVNVKDLLSHD